MRIIAEAASGKAYRSKCEIPRKYLFPYDLVEKGDEGKALKKEKATREEYVLGLKRMEAQRRFSAHALPALSRHQETARYHGKSLEDTQRRFSHGSQKAGSRKAGTTRPT